MSTPPLAALVLAPLACAVVLALVPPPRRAWPAVLAGAGTAALAGWTVAVVALGDPITQHLAGWRPPLGIALHADALSSSLVLLSAVVVLAVLIYATGHPSARGTEMFWPLTFLLWSGLNAVFLAGDLFNAYVALELMGLAAVALVTLGGRTAWRPGLNYLIVAVAGSLVYLLGVALVYAETGTLDLAQAGEVMPAGVNAAVALALIASGMALKTALFPVHSWLPAAHAAAPSAVSPLLSALVIKASLYLLIRVWITVFGGSAPAAIGTALAVLGSVAVVWGTVVALRQDRVKVIVAYSTVAQVGYFFLLFAFLTPALHPEAPEPVVAAARAAWGGILILALSHGLAKAGMFLAAGVLSLAHDGEELAGLAGAVNRMPGTVVAFAVCGVVLAGIPPTLGFAGKWQVLQAGLIGGQWWWLVPVLAGGLLTFAYTARVVRATFDRPGHEGAGQARAVPARMRVVALVLALAAVVLGFGAVPLADFLERALPVGVG